MMIRTYEPDFAYLPDTLFRPYEAVVGVELECEGAVINFVIADEPLQFASGLEAAARAIRRKYGDA